MTPPMIEHFARIDPEDMTEDELDEAFMLLVAKLSRTQQEQLLDILADVMGITAPDQATLRAIS